MSYLKLGIVSYGSANVVRLEAKVEYGVAPFFLGMVYNSNISPTADMILQ